MLFEKAPVIALLAALMIALTGCASTDQPMYVDSEEVGDLKVPETLDEPTPRTDYEVPGYYLPELAAGRDMGRPPQVQSSVDAEASDAQIRFGARGLHLEVEASAEQVMETLSAVLNDSQAGLTVEDMNAQSQRFSFQYKHQAIVIPKRGLSRLMVWREDEVIDFSDHYQARVVGIGQARARVELLSGEGELLNMDKAEHVLAILRERLG